MVNISREDYIFLISLGVSLFADGMVNFTYEDEIKFEEIEKKYEKK